MAEETGIPGSEVRVLERLPGTVVQRTWYRVRREGERKRMVFFLACLRADNRPILATDAAHPMAGWFDWRDLPALPFRYAWVGTILRRARVAAVALGRTGETFASRGHREWPDHRRKLTDRSRLPWRLPPIGE
jgi:hypothetical protein